MPHPRPPLQTSPTRTFRPRTVELSLKSTRPEGLSPAMVPPAAERCPAHCVAGRGLGMWAGGPRGLQMLPCGDRVCPALTCHASRHPLVRAVGVGWAGGPAGLGHTHDTRLPSQRGTRESLPQSRGCPRPPKQRPFVPRPLVPGPPVQKSDVRADRHDAGSAGTGRARACSHTQTRSHSRVRLRETPGGQALRSLQLRVA